MSHDVRRYLETIANARILLGHQSVGRNVIAGVKAVSKETGVEIRIEEVDSVPPDSKPGLFHSHVGRNGDGDSKCEAFERLLVRPERPAYDLAMMKFCYADLGRGIGVEASAMLDRYSRLVAELREERPDVRIVHVTMPLRAEPRGWKTTVKRIIGRDVPRDADNALRNEFNDALRECYPDQPFFDIAALESTRRDGSRSSFSFDGGTIYSLAAEYTDDGGHLNAEAQRLAAAEFLRTLAAAL